ncbi:hypothetical protein FocTR4_00007478 [Fusarium oxysporum f. sp. cubense]|uniref:Uncharacterized protein n=1 Tax=Fusarium oxysporum f. sp. cubense TaxID=61366 RepID=A0A5C6TJX4_FUSOC|nr:hypothetical protein FocTR4_00007478 [Fusarium oxysporum f. sp. cubense]
MNVHSVIKFSGGLMSLVAMHALAMPDKADLFHHKPSEAESFELVITAHDNPTHPSMDAIVAREPERISEMPAWEQRETVGWSSGTVDPRFLLFDLSDMLLDEPQDYGDTENNPLQFSGVFGPSTASHISLSWDSLWADAYERIPKDERKWLGIGKHTPEVMALSRRTIELIESGEAKESAYLQDIAFYDMAVFHEFVQKYGQGSPSASKN